MKLESFFTFITILLLTASCGNSPKQVTAESSDTEQPTSAEWAEKYDKIEPSEIPDNVMQLIGQEWMLVTAGKKDSFNTMTASWGGLTYVWERPASIIYIRDTRYTYQFLQKEDSFTLSFFPEEYRGALRICGTKSGRDTDKVKESGLTPIETPTGLISFTQARMIIECKKMLVQELDYNNLTEPYKKKIIEESYTGETSKHQLFISEITNVWVKK